MRKRDKDEIICYTGFFAIGSSVIASIVWNSKDIYNALIDIVKGVPVAYTIVITIAAKIYSVSTYSFGNILWTVFLLGLLLLLWFLLRVSGEY